MSGRKPVLSKHMKKAVERLETLSGTVNLALEVVDARAPLSTECGIMTRVLRGAHQVIVFTKADLADAGETRKWMAWHKAKGRTAVVFPHGKQKKRSTFIKEITDDFRNAGGGEKVKAVVVGLPNVGKSTVLNMLTGGKRAKVGAMPGITRGVQLINVDKDFLIIDTPGVVSSAYAGNEDREKTLALVGCLQDKFFEPEEALYHLLESILPEYAAHLKNIYDLDEKPVDYETFCEAVARRRGFLKKGGIVDFEKVAPIVVKDFSTGRIAGITLEKVMGRK